MNQIKGIFEELNIDSNRLMIFTKGEEVAFISPLMILDKIGALQLKQQTRVLQSFEKIKHDKKKVFNYLDQLGRCLVRIKL